MELDLEGLKPSQIETANFFHGLFGADKNYLDFMFHSHLRSKAKSRRVLNMLSDPEIRKTIDMYEGDQKRAPAHEFVAATYFGKEKIEFVKKVASNPEIVSNINALKRYSPESTASHVLSMALDDYGPELPLELSRLLVEYDKLVDQVENAYGERDKIIPILSGYMGTMANMVSESKAIALVRAARSDALKRAFKKYGTEFAHELFRVDILDDEFNRKKTINIMKDMPAKHSDAYRCLTPQEAERMAGIVMSDLAEKFLSSNSDERRNIASILINQSARREALGRNGLMDTLHMVRRMGGFGTPGSRDLPLLDIIDNDLQKVVTPESIGHISTYLSAKWRLPKPTAENIGSYQSIIEDTFRSYNIPEGLDLDKKIMILNETKDHVLSDIIDLHKRARKRNVRTYSMNLDAADEIRYGKEEILRSSIISVIGSRDPARDAEAVKITSSIVGNYTINKARDDFRKKHKGLLRSVVDAFNNGKYGDARAILESTDAESILDVMSSADYEESSIAGAKFVKAYETKDPLNFDSKTQMCCVYLPREDDEKRGIVKYCKDDRFILVSYDVGGKPMGSAICYRDGDNIVVDSVEGGRGFRNDKIFEIVYNDVVSRAGKKRAAKIIFGVDGTNLTSKMFNEYLSKKSLRNVLLIGPDSEVPQSDIRNGTAIVVGLRTRGYLETKRNRPAYAVEIPAV